MSRSARAVLLLLVGTLTLGACASSPQPRPSSPRCRFGYGGIEEEIWIEDGEMHSRFL